MRDEYDFSNAIQNPYIQKIKHQTPVNIDNDSIAYFKQLSLQKGIPYQTLINLFLEDCAKRKLEPDFTWGK